MCTSILQICLTYRINIHVLCGVNFIQKDHTLICREILRGTCKVRLVMYTFYVSLIIGRSDMSSHIKVSSYGCLPVHPQDPNNSVSASLQYHDTAAMLK